MTSAEGVCCDSSVRAVQGGGEERDGGPSCSDVSSDSGPGSSKGGIAGAKEKNETLDIEFKTASSRAGNRARSCLRPEVIWLCDDSGQMEIDELTDKTRHCSDNRFAKRWRR